MALVQRKGSFSHTATGVLGDKRNTMLANEMHQRPRLARPLTRGHLLPEDSFVYGQKNEKTTGVPDALVWPSSYNSLMKSRDKLGKRDFVALNREAIRAGLATSRELNMYRCTHDIRQKPETEEKKRSFVRRIPPTRVYGVATRPSTPIFDLLAHKYQDDWINDNLMHDSYDSESTKGKRFMPPYETRASLLRNYSIPVDQGAPWQMAKFTKSAQPHLSTYWSDKDREASFKHHAYDSIGRRGFQGHGVYMPAIN